jgi:hypothetical protein
MLGRFFDYYGVGFICRDDPRLARCNRDRLTGCILMQLEQMLAISEEQPECFFTVGGRKRNRRIFDSAQKKTNIRLHFLLKRRLTCTLLQSFPGLAAGSVANSGILAEVLLSQRRCASLCSFPAAPFVSQSLFGLRLAAS